MTIRPFAFLTKRRSIKTVALGAIILVYIVASVFLFFIWVNPSLDGRTDQHIAADSSTYLSFAKSLREGADDPIVLAALAPFPNNLWSPVAQAFLLQSTFLMMLTNYAMFFLSVYLFGKAFSISPGFFIALLLLNFTTAISLLSVNKEIPDMLALAMFCYARHVNRKFLLVLSLLLALINRYEVFVVMLLFLFATSRLNPLRNKRLPSLVLLTLAITIALPIFGASALAYRFEEASGGGLVTLLDGLEIHYLYIVAVIPKILHNMFGELFSFSKWISYGATDPANSYIVWFNNLANAVVISLLFIRRSFSLKSDAIYFAAIGSVVMAIALVIQPRYFYFVYVLLCIEASKKVSFSSLASRMPGGTYEAPLHA